MLDFKTAFRGGSGSLSLEPDFRIVAAGSGYLSATMTRLNDIVGRDILDVLPVGSLRGLPPALWALVSLVRSLVLAEPPLLRWLPGLQGGQRLYDDLMNGVWNPTGREFLRGKPEKAMRLTIDWFGRNGYLIDGKPARFDTLPAETLAFIMENALEWQALTTSSDAFSMLDRAAVKAVKVPILLMSGQNTMLMNKRINAELERLLPKAETVVIRDATHEMWAEQPDACRARVASFFAKH
jgi:pimeloyl-ACP methyl ester carboxylesterase